MRIEFPNSAREDFHWDGPVLRIGSAPDNDLILASHQAGAYHLRIQLDRRGWVLQMLPQGNRIYVNARPVREKPCFAPATFSAWATAACCCVPTRNPRTACP